jgi:hypothetical protein
LQIWQLFQRGPSLNSGKTEASQDQAAREPVNIRACGVMRGSLSSDPAGIKAMPIFSMSRGTREPQLLQKQLVNRSASGTL